MSRLPPELARRFEIVDTLPGGGQADVYVVKGRASEGHQVLKLYQESATPLAKSSYTEVLSVWQRRSACAGDAIVALHSFGSLGPIDRNGQPRYQAYEVQEYIEAGTLRPVLTNASDGERSGLAKHLVGELGRLLRFTHREMGIWHSDIKPENLFVRATSPDGLPALVLGDFGSASERIVSVQLASKKHLTPQYAAPEVFEDERLLTEQRDYWSAGVIVYEAACGRRPYEGRDIGLAFKMINTPVDLTPISDERLQLLLSGLLHREAEKRWGADELSQWVDGGSPEVLPDEFGQSATARSAVGFNVQGEIAWSISDLVKLLNLAWREADNDYLRPSGPRASELVDWLVENFGTSADAAVDIVVEPTPEGLDPSVWSDRKLARLGAAYRPTDPVFRPSAPGTGRLTLSDLEEAAAGALGDHGAEHNTWLGELFESDALMFWSAAQGAEPALAELVHRWRASADELQLNDLAPMDHNGEVLLASLNAEYRAGLALRAAEAANDQLALQQDWFRELADRSEPADELIARDICILARLDEAREETVRQDDDAALMYRGPAGRVRRARAWLQARSTERRPPILEIWTASFERAPIGTPLTIDWATQNAASVTISNLGQVEEAGSHTFIPAESGAVVITVVAPGGMTRQRRHEYTVDSKPQFAHCEVSPHAVVAGAPVLISWSAPGAQQVEIVGVGIGGADGSLAHYPGAARGYRLIATNSAGTTSTQTRSVNVVVAAPFETQVLRVPAADVPIEVPVVLLPEMEHVFEPAIADIVAATPIGQHLIRSARHSVHRRRQRQWRELPTPPPIPALPELELPDVPDLDHLIAPQGER